MTKLVYTGPPPFVSLLAQILNEDGIETEYEPPVEHRSIGADAHDVVVALVASGAYDVIKASVARFKATRLGKTAEVEIEDDN